MNAKVLVADPIAQDGIELLRRYFEVDIQVGLSPAELRSLIGDYDAIIVRSETRVTAEVIEAGARLQVIGRAGVGVDNIDLAAATRRGVVVVNAPLGNIVSAAEHTIGLMLALARHIPQADASLKAGKWERDKFLGVELRGKTLGILGLGQVGSEVARRARGLEMQLIAHDPFVAEERARVMGVELVSFERLLEEADFLTVHAPLTASTRGLIGERELRRMKPNARLINAARGGIIDEEALYRAVEERWIAGAAVDVFTTEPARDNILTKSDRIITTPHLGASTAEAQERVATDVAKQVIAVLHGEPAPYAVNAPLIPPETLAALAPYMQVAVQVGSLATQLSAGQLGNVEIEYTGEIANYDTTPLKAAVIKGLLAPISEENVTIVNANFVAEHRGLRISERKSPSAHDVYANLLSVCLTTSAGTTTVTGTMAYDGPHIVRINDFWVDVPPGDGYLLLCENLDRPGMIGKVGTILGEADININAMRVGGNKRGRALMVLGLDEPVPPDILKQINDVPDIYQARLVRL